MSLITKTQSLIGGDTYYVAGPPYYISKVQTILNLKTKLRLLHKGLCVQYRKTMIDMCPTEE